MIRIQRGRVSKKHPLLRVFLQAVAALCLLLPAACGPPPPRAATRMPTPTLIAATPTVTIGPGTPLPGLTLSPAAGELRLALRETITTLNPYLVTNASESFVVSLLYDTLTEEDSQGALKPNLAERWELSPDGRRLTCWLNPRARWHDGRQVSADDVAFTFSFVRQKAFPGWVPIVALVQRVEAISHSEVQFSLLPANAEAVRRMCTAVPIVPTALWDGTDDPLSSANLDNPIGSGPFALLEHTSEGQLVLRSTMMHHSESPRVATLVLEIVHDETAALQALQDDTLDALGWDVVPAVVKDVRDQPDQYMGIQWMASPGPSVQTLLFNLRHTPYDDAELRIALGQALDTQALVEEVLLGFGSPGTADLFPPASPWHDESIAPLSFDPQAAMQKLTAAGYVDTNDDGLREDRDGVPLEITITCPKQDVPLQVVGLITGYWRAVGIRAKAAPISPDQMLPTLMNASFDVALNSLSLAEPQMAFSYFHSSRGLLSNGRVSGFNYGGYANTEYDRIAEEMLEELNPGKHLELLRRLQGILAADLPQIPLYSAHVLNLYRDSRVVGWKAQLGSGLLSRAAIVGLRPQ